MHHDDDAHLRDVAADRIFALTRPDDALRTLYLIYSVLSTVAFPFVFLPLYFRFITLRYRFDAEGVAVSYGLLWRRESYLTYARIQDIHVSRNIFERWLGIGTVEIQTAAGSSGAEEAIVGVRAYDEIRNFLYARMRGHRLSGMRSAEFGMRNEGDPAIPQSTLRTPHSTDAVLAGIRDELRAVRQLLEAEERRHV